MVGNQWRLQLHPVPVTGEGDEQPLEVAALVEALVESMVWTKDRRYGLEAVHTFEWFLGRNRYVVSFNSGVPVTLRVAVVGAVVALDLIRAKEENSSGG